jgi:hypothetical protein
LQFREHLVKSVVTLIDALFHARLEHPITVRNRLENRLNRHSRATARQRFEPRCFETDMPGFRQPLKLKGPDGPLRSQDLVIHSTECIFIAILVFVYLSPGSAALRFKGLKSHRVFSRSDPLRIELRVCVGFEDQLSWCVKLPYDDEFLFAGLRRDLGLAYFFYNGFGFAHG